MPMNVRVGQDRARTLEPFFPGRGARQIPSADRRARVSDLWSRTLSSPSLCIQTRPAVICQDRVSADITCNTPNKAVGIALMIIGIALIAFGTPFVAFNPVIGIVLTLGGLASVVIGASLISTSE